MRAVIERRKERERDGGGDESCDRKEGERERLGVRAVIERRRERERDGGGE